MRTVVSVCVLGLLLSTTALADDEYQYDDGLADGATGLTAGGTLGWMHVFETGAANVITGISTSFPPRQFERGQEFSVYLYSDDDMDPLNGLTLLTSATAAAFEVDDPRVLLKVDIDDTVIVTSHFWIMVVMDHPDGTLPASKDNSQDSDGRAWITGDTGFNFDPENLLNNDVPTMELDSIGLNGVWMLRANAVPAPGACIWDIDGNGSVGASDLLSLLVSWGPCPPKEDCPADFNGDGTVGSADLLALLVNWGPCP